MSCLCHYGPAILRFWFQTYLGNENSASYLKTQAEKTFCYHGHALVTLYVQFLCSDWSKFDRWVHAENLCSILKLVYFWQLKLTEFCVNLWCFLMSFSTGCTKWNTAAINCLLLFMAGLFTEFLVEKCSACQSWKSDFGWHRFCFSPCWMRVEKSLKRFWLACVQTFPLLFFIWGRGDVCTQAILALLGSFQELHLEW